MKLSEVSIERPVLATVMSLLIVIFGIISLGRLSNRELPDVDPPIVAVTTIYPGAAAEVVETSVTQPLEDELIAIEGIKHITSESRELVSSITIEFELSRDVDLAANDVRDRVGRARQRLPDEIEETVVAKRDADAFPILWLGLSSERHSQVELSTIAETQIKDRLSKLTGVSEVVIGGERRYSMRVWIDNARLTAHDLTVVDVEQALRRGNVEIPSGRLEGPGREVTVRTLGELKTPEEFRHLMVAWKSEGPVRLGDVARVEVGAEDDRKLVRYNGKSAVGMGVVRQSKANTLVVAALVHEEIDAVQEDLPAGVTLEASFDQSIFIRRSIEDVTATILQAIVLVVLVIYVFLRRFRATIIPVVSIPISIMGAITVLYFFGYSVNTLTLMGITLAIGLVVDDAIVVLENISRWIEQGATPLEAAKKGMTEISFAVVSATASVIAVFLPLVFLTDATGRLFREFGTTVAAAVATSGFVALTLSPMLCARVLRRKQSEESGLKLWLARGLARMQDAYGRLLAPVLRRPGLVTLGGVAWFVLGMVLLQTIDREFIPTADRGSIMAFTRAPEGSTLGYTARYQQQVEEAFLAVPEMEKVFSILALGLGTPGLVNEGAIFSTLARWENRDRTQQEIVEELQMKLWQVPGLFAFPMNPEPLAQGFGSTPVELVIQGPDLSQLAEYADEIARRAASVSGMINPRTDLFTNKPQLEVTVDRDRASDLGVSVRDVATTLQILLGGLDLSTFKLHGETYNVMVQLEHERRMTPRDLSGLYVYGKNDLLIPLISVVEARASTAPRALPHFDRARAVTVQADLARGAPLGDALVAIERIADEVIPKGRGYRTTWSGQSEDFFESSSAIAFAYALAVLIVYLVLAAQFESFLHPVTVLVAVALSFPGALLALEATGSTLNLFSQIGLVLLVGLVTKNSILIVEFANQLRDRGHDVLDATLDAARIRFRPILMTAFSTILGILPIALGLGAGGESRAPLGIAVVGGMLFSTLLTIFVVPAIYVLFARSVEPLLSRAEPEATGERAAT